MAICDPIRTCMLVFGSVGGSEGRFLNRAWRMRPTAEAYDQFIRNALNQTHGVEAAKEFAARGPYGLFLTLFAQIIPNG